MSISSDVAAYHIYYCTLHSECVGPCLDVAWLAPVYHSSVAGQLISCTRPRRHHHTAAAKANGTTKSTCPHRSERVRKQQKAAGKGSERASPAGSWSIKVPPPSRDSSSPELKRGYSVAFVDIDVVVAFPRICLIPRIRGEVRLLLGVRGEVRCLRGAGAGSPTSS
eukprot:2478362-Rhodomonas_salina.1